MSKKGFTIIELLMVIAIIGILASTVLVSLNQTRVRARDARRLGDLKQFETALELYYSNHGIYPCGDANDTIPENPGGTGDSTLSCPADPSSDLAGFLNGSTGISVPNCVGITTGLHSDGILPSNCPKDPVNSYDPSATSIYYGYRVSADRQKYVIAAYLETKANLMANDGGRCADIYEIGPGKGLFPFYDLGPPGCL